MHQDRFRDTALNWSMTVVATFYKFVSLTDLETLQAQVRSQCEPYGIQGTILLAPEGINGTIAGSRDAMDQLLDWLRSDRRFSDLEVKESTTDSPPFDRLKVRLKQEIVPLGVPAVDPNQQVGEYVDPKDWNAVISDPDVVVVDTRNDYEVAIGTFRGAKDPNTEKFREFPQYVDQNLDPARHAKVAMFCTGGIRCEKATSYLLSQGFQTVYHLKGGILKYLEEIPPDQSLWEGECFVFDQRVAVKHGLEPGSYAFCHACGRPISNEDKASPKYQRGVSCPHCFDSLSEEKKARNCERQRQLDLAKQRRQRSSNSTS